MAQPDPGPYDYSAHPTHQMTRRQSGRSFAAAAWTMVGIAIGLVVIGGLLIFAAGPVTEAIEKHMDPVYQGFVGREAELVNLEGKPTLTVYHDMSGVYREREIIREFNPIRKLELAVDHARYSGASHFPAGQRVKIVDVAFLRQASVDDRAAQVVNLSDPRAPVVWVAVANLRRMD